VASDPVRTDRLDDFAELSGWLPVAPGEARLSLLREAVSDGAALSLEFDFRGGGGFVVARKEFRRPMPPVFTLEFRVRGDAPPNRLEVKLADASGRNVWWHRRESFRPSNEWAPIEIRSRDFEFAWGPAGGGVIGELGAIEIAVVAPPGGQGRLSIADLRLVDRSDHPAAIATASRELPGHEAAAVLERNEARSWRSGPTSESESLELDLGIEREHGGFVIEWEAGLVGRDFDLRVSRDRTEWTLVRAVRNASATRSYIYAAGGGDARYVRLDLHRAEGNAGFGIRSIEIAPFEFSRSIETFFTGIAKREPRGRYPRWLYGEQAYWTSTAAAVGGPRALLNEDGLLEIGRAAFSLEPSLFAGGALQTWADADSIEQSLADDRLPIPSVRWRSGDVLLETTAFATSDEGRAAISVRYRVENLGATPLVTTLYVAIRPFQVNPPWQAFRGMGGAARIETIELEDDVVWVNGERALVPSPLPHRFGAASFDDGAITGYMASGHLPETTKVNDAFGYASAALAYDFTLAPGESAVASVIAPFARLSREAAEPLARWRRRSDEDAGLAGALDAALSAWRDRVSTVELDLGAAAPEVAHTVATATGHILVNRYGAALQPGPRRYTRSWIRDGATMSAALLRMGRADEARDFLRWYTPYQAADGNVPCCVDEKGPDWLVEHDSHGQLIYTAMEHFRFTGDRAFLEEMWPHAAEAARYIETLRESRLTPAQESGEGKLSYGLLPESVSHEGYLAQPVHSYWDDFWALRGTSDAAEMASVLGKGADAARLSALHSALGRSLYASIDAVIAKKQLEYVPGSVEWADFDPSATATAIQTTDAADRLPAANLHAMFDNYLKGFRDRRDGKIEWTNYTAYEIRIIGALVRLGRRDEANELLDFFLGDRRPLSWNQWPEISWRDSRSGGHLGDLPHSWIGAEYVLSVLSMLAYERASDRTLVVAAGVPLSWLQGGVPIRIRGLPTYYGSLDGSLVRESESELRLSISSALEPPGGIELRPPLLRPLLEVTIDGNRAAAQEASGVTIARGPADVCFRF